MLSRRALVAGVPMAATLAMPAETRAATAGIDSGGGVVTAGLHRIDTDFEVTGDLLLLPGARIDIAAGRTLTIRGSFDAPLAWVFSGDGRVDMTAARITAAHPEWWGAHADDGNADNLAALEACLAAHPVMRLRSADYFIRDTWKIARSNRTILGAGKNWRGPNTGTRLVIQKARAATADVVQIGTDRDPGGVERYVHNVRLSGVHLVRDGPVAPPSGDGRGAAGLRLQFAVELTIDEISTENNVIGIYVGGVVHSFLRRCNIGQGLSWTRNDGAFTGLMFDGDVAGGYAGGNASIYVEDCAVAGPGSGAPLDSVAAHLKGAFADTFLIRLECAGCRAGIRLEGLGGSGPGLRDRQKSGNADVHVMMPILDQVWHGIELIRLSDHAMADVTSPYIAVAPGGTAAVRADRSGGQVTVTGGQLIGWGDAERGGAAAGLLARNSAGFDLRGTKLLGFARPIEMSDCADFTLDLSINNPAQATRRPAIRLDRCARGRVQASVRGAAGAFPTGVGVDGGSRQIAVDATGIDPGCLSAGAAAKVRVGDTAVREAGPVGHNLVTGIVR